MTATTTGSLTTSLCRYSTPSYPSIYPALDATKQGWFYGPFLEGYTRHMDISDEWIKRIPGFIRFRRADLFAFICKELDIDNLTDAWDIKAIQRIREGFFIQEPLV